MALGVTVSWYCERFVQELSWRPSAEALRVSTLTMWGDRRDRDFPLAAPIDIPGSVAFLLLVSDGGTSRTSLRATVECVCEDSARFEDAEGDGCLAYAQGSGTKHALGMSDIGLDLSNYHPEDEEEEEEDMET